MKSAWFCLALVICSTAVANDYGGGWGGGNPSDPWYGNIMPSGLRFGGTPTISVQTGATVDGAGNGGYVNGYAGGPGPCMGCGMGTCTHWTLRPWYAHWGPDGIGYVPHHHHHCRQCCVSAPCD